MVTPQNAHPSAEEIVKSQGGLCGGNIQMTGQDMVIYIYCNSLTSGNHYQKIYLTFLTKTINVCRPYELRQKFLTGATTGAEPQPQVFHEK